VLAGCSDEGLPKELKQVFANERMMKQNANNIAEKAPA
jgi:hypothetical protein